MNNRKLAKQILKENNFSNEQANNAWYNQVLALRRNSDLRGKELRDQAYRNIATSFIKDPTNRQLTAEPITVMTSQPSFNGAQTILPLQERVKAVAPQYKTFGEAFAAARNAGLKEFEYNGGKYNTMSKEELETLKKQEADRKRKFTGDFNTDRDYNRGHFAILERPGIQASVPEIEIPEIQDSNVKVPDKFSPLRVTWFKTLKPIFFDENPQIGWPMPIKGENAVTDYSNNWIWTWETPSS